MTLERFSLELAATREYNRRSLLSKAFSERYKPCGTVLAAPREGKDPEQDEEEVLKGS